MTGGPRESHIPQADFFPGNVPEWAISPLTKEVFIDALKLDARRTLFQIMHRIESAHLPKGQWGVSGLPIHERSQLRVAQFDEHCRTRGLWRVPLGRHTWHPCTVVI